MSGTAKMISTEIPADDASGVNNDDGFERLKWRFDTRSITLEWLPSGELVLSQGSWCRVLPDLRAAHHFARLVGV